MIFIGSENSFWGFIPHITSNIFKYTYIPHQIEIFVIKIGKIYEFAFEIIYSE